MNDKSSILQIFGSLMKHPQFLSETDKYNLTLNDFNSRFDKYIFASISNLYEHGAQRISPIDIDNYLETKAAWKTVFEKNNGIEYLQDAEYLADEKNFEYYYTRLKKFNALNELKKKGIDISRFYVEDLTNIKALEINEKFENLRIEDIFETVKKDILTLENEFSKTGEVESWNIAEEIDDIISNLGNLENIGLPINGDICSEIINGAELGALTIRSAPSGLGKTRLAVADACKLAYPVQFNLSNYSWERTGSNEKVLFIMTEQKPEQIINMVLAYLTGINESKFRFMNLTQEEEKRLQIGIQIIKKFKHNFEMMRIPNPNIQLVKTAIREKVITCQTKYVFYDYVFVSPSLLDEFRGKNIRQDEALLMFATALKDIAIEQNVSVFTSTQVNAKADDNSNIRNEASLAGGRSTITKADNGIIVSRPTKEELELLKNNSTIIPTHVFDFYKVRSGRWTQVRVWSYFDAGTLRLKDLFITDSRLNLIEGFYEDSPVIEWELDGQDEIENFIKEINL